MSNDSDEIAQSGGVSTDALLATIRELAQAWARRIDHMPPLAAQQFLASRTAELLAGLSESCGSKISGLIATYIESTVWGIYDRRHRQAGA